MAVSGAFPGSEELEDCGGDGDWWGEGGGCSGEFVEGGWGGCWADGEVGGRGDEGEVGEEGGGVSIGS